MAYSAGEAAMTSAAPKLKVVRDNAKMKARNTATAAPAPAQAPVPAEGHDAGLPQFDTLDRVNRALLARLTHGISPWAMARAWADWATHLAAASGRQTELAQKAMADMARIGAYAMTRGGDAGDGVGPPFAPKAGDHRFGCPLHTSDAADDPLCVDFGVCRYIKKNILYIIHT